MPGMRLLALLGSGSSRPAGMPSTADITDKVFSGQGIMRGTDKVYCLDRNLEPTSEWDARVKLLTQNLFSEIEVYYRDRRSHPVNYENCCYVATQLCDALSGEFDNPAVMPLVEKLANGEGLHPLFEKDPERLLFQETEHYIRDVVWGMLSRKPESVSYLKWLADMARDEDVQSIDFVTLNHDTILEQSFRSHSVDFCDGFGEATNGVRFWQYDRLEVPRRVRLIKLHGSIDWFFFEEERKVGISQNHNPFRRIASRPELLVGTFNKMLGYTTGIFADLHCYFHRTLRHTQYLVCCGYGFGDKGINTKLSEWINAGPDRRLIVVHPDPCQLSGCSRGAIKHNWDFWRKQGKLLPVEKWVQEVSWDEIKRELRR